MTLTCRMRICLGTLSSLCLTQMLARFGLKSGVGRATAPCSSFPRLGAPNTILALLSVHRPPSTLHFSISTSSTPPLDLQSSRLHLRIFTHTFLLSSLDLTARLRSTTRNRTGLGQPDVVSTFAPDAPTTNLASCQRCQHQRLELRRLWVGRLIYRLID